MNLLEQIPLTQVGDELTIRLSNIKAGWMDISIVTGTSTYRYHASYLYDAPLNLVETAVKLLQNQPENKSAVLYHDLEKSMVAWYLISSGDSLSVFVWDNMYPDPFDDYIDCNFESECMEALDENIDLSKGLVLAFEITVRQFALTISAAFTDLANNYSKAEYAENWWNAYPEAQLKLLKQILKD